MGLKLRSVPSSRAPILRSPRRACTFSRSVLNSTRSAAVCFRHVEKTRTAGCAAGPLVGDAINHPAPGLLVGDAEIEEGVKVGVGLDPEHKIAPDVRVHGDGVQWRPVFGADRP